MNRRLSFVGGQWGDAPHASGDEPNSNWAYAEASESKNARKGIETHCSSSQIDLPNVERIKKCPQGH